MRPILEYCTDDVKKALLAEKNGANRIEFCADLNNEGLTPKIEDVKRLIGLLQIPVRIMIRPKNSFFFDEETKKVFFNELLGFMDIGVNEFVVGYISKEGTPDYKFLDELSQQINKQKCTFHKAIDHCTDLVQCLKELENYTCIDSILSSGGKSTAKEGMNTLLEMQSVSSKTIIAAGKITYNNISEISSDKIKAYHGRKIVNINVRPNLS